MVEGEDKPPAVNEVPEYAAEIHTYLREMEVNWAPISKCFCFHIAVLQMFTFSQLTLTRS